MTKYPKKTSEHIEIVKKKCKKAVSSYWRFFSV